MNPDRWLEENFGGEYFSGRFEHLKRTVNDLKLNRQLPKVITIAGTNGKGETARLLAHLMSSHKKRYALWTSPHLETVCERFVFNDKFVGEQELLAALEKVKANLGEVRGYSYFEFIFLTFLQLCQQKDLDYILLEVGLGGRLDASNAIDADLACVVSISREHQKLLGHTFSKILHEKLGVSRSGKKLFTAFDLDYLKRLTENYAQEHSIEWTDLVKSGKISKQDDFSMRNKILATQLFESATGEKSAKDLENVNLAMRARLEQDNQVFDLYPTHNLDGFRKLFHFLEGKQYNNYDYLLISFSKREWKDLLGICSLVSQKFPCEKIKLVAFHHLKSLEDSQLRKLASDYKFDIVQLEKISDVFEASTKVLVTGSNYFLGEFLQFSKSRK